METISGTGNNSRKYHNGQSTIILTQTDQSQVAILYLDVNVFFWCSVCGSESSGCVSLMDASVVYLQIPWKWVEILNSKIYHLLFYRCDEFPHLTVKPKISLKTIVNMFLHSIWLLTINWDDCMRHSQVSPERRRFISPETISFRWK